MNKLSSIALAHAVLLSSIFGVVAMGTAQAQPKPGIPKELIVQTPATSRTEQPGEATHPKAVGKTPVPSPGAPERAMLRLDHVPVAAYIVSAKNPPRVVDLADAPVRLTPGELLVTKSSEKAIFLPASAATREGAKRVLLPYEMRFLERSGEVRTSRVVAEIAGGGLRVAAKGVTFLGELFVELEDTTDRTASYPLPQPAELLVTAAVDRVLPSVFRIERTNQWTSVKLEAGHPRDPVTVKIQASTDKSGLEFEVPVLRPQLALKVSPRRVYGLGLETAIISVLANDLPDPSGRGITLSATQGRLGTTQLKLDETATASTDIRSIGIGQTEIEAVSPPLVGARSSELEFVWPTAFLVAAILGGGIGGALRHLQATRKSSPQRRGWTLDLLAGVLAGLAIGVLYAIGINVLRVAPTATAGEALVFGLAVLGGLWGFRGRSGSRLAS
jgi:hypothetical protein